eukprot:CAMPEP_0119052898 /NCGR_PEP_ID=MMETSP1177-20130426/74043_1 /TAXON_ID=2985 /ORGANISM="Ochromonas sp, Strain CCMP1899" /LENGTH=56 /DNA_ID=CAMNT_0007032621 /DNA_START=1515 /DNA_END=1685 /DNA_ORIENTATION=+
MNIILDNDGEGSETEDGFEDDDDDDITDYDEVEGFDTEEDDYDDDTNEFLENEWRL